MRSLTTFVAALALAGVLFPRSLGAAPVPPTNLLANPSFEQGQPGAADLAVGWTRYQCGYTRSRERSYAPDIAGPWSCRISGAGREDEKGLGGCNTGVVDLPGHGTFAATNSIYLADYTQGSIYGAYLTARYADGSEKTYSFTLTDAQIKANLGVWKTYRLTFTTDPAKQLKGLTYWCLVWKRGEQKFIGTVYFDELELRQVVTAAGTESALPFVLAGRATHAPRLDGVDDDPCWRQAVELPPFLLSGGAQPAGEQTRTRLAYDDQHLYLFVECYESVLDPVLQKQAAFKATQRGQDANVFADDAIELFLQPAPEQGVYHHLAVNSLGAIYDARCPKPGVYESAWDSGAEARCRVGDKSWTVELTVPRAALAEGSFGPAERWRVNVCRSEKPSSENSCWSPTGGPFHTPARFGLVGFGPPALGLGQVDPGGLRKGVNRLRLTVDNPGDEPRTVTVLAAVTASGGMEVGRTTARLAPGQSDSLVVEYLVRSGDGALVYEVYDGDRLLLVSPGYPLRSDNPFIAWVNVLGKAQTRVLTSFSVAQGELLTLPVVILAGIDETQFRDAEVSLELPAWLRLVTPVSATRRCPTPLAVEEQLVEAGGRARRRLTLRFGAGSVTFPPAAEQRQYVLNPLVFRAEYVGSEPPAAEIGYELRVNGQARAAGGVPLHLLPPFARKSPREVVVCNWPCGGTFHNAYFQRLSAEEQQATGESWLRTGSNIFTHATSLAELYHDAGRRTAHGLPGTLDSICQSIPELVAWLRANPQYQDATQDGKPLPTSISPAHLLAEDCPARQMIRDYAGKAARQYPVLSWDYEVPVARSESIGFGAHNLAAFRAFAKLPETAELTGETVVRDHLQHWIDFRCRQNAEVVKLLREGIKAANPDCLFFVYSGYQRAHTRETYGIDWAYVAPHLDQAWCGYGRPVTETQDTLLALGGKPLVGGELVWLGYGGAYDLDTTESNLMRRLTDCAGGVMVYYDWFVDGRFYTALSHTAAVAADFEPFFRKGRRDDSLATVAEGDAANVAVYTLGAERLLVLFGSATGARRFRLQLRDLPPGAVGLDYWTKQKLPVAPLETEVPAHGVKVVLVTSPGAAVPAAPRLVAPVDQAVADRRPLLVWEHDGGAVCRYRVQVASSPEFEPATLVSAADRAVNTQVVTEPLDESGTYHWRVRAVDALTGKAGAWSPVGRFTLGVLDVTVQPTRFSPNGDGLVDTVALEAELRRAAPWTVTVVDAAGREVRSFRGAGVRPAVSWDGRDAAGKPAADGRYEVRLAINGKPVAARSVELNQRFGVPNRDLERWCFWRPQALEGGATEQDYQTVAGDRSYSLRLSGDGPEARAYWSNYRSGTEIPITAGQEYTYSGLVKADLAPGGKATVSLHFFTADDRWAAIPGLEAEWEGIVAEAAAKPDWQRLTVSCRAPANAAKAVLFFSIKGQGRAWLAAAEFGESGR